jgi:hypothetical protein
VRWLLTWSLAMLLVLLTPLAIAGAWARSVVFDTDRYVATIGPLADDPAVQAALADQISEQVVAAVDISSVVDGALDLLPFSTSFLPLDELVEPAQRWLDDIVRENVTALVASDGFSAAWTSANRTGHEQLVGALTGDSDLVTIDDTDVSVQAELFVEAVRVGLASAGLQAVAELIPSVPLEFVVFSSAALPYVQAAMRLLDVVGAWMWVVVILLAVAVALLAPRRRQGVAVAAGSLLVGAVVLGAGLSIVRRLYVSDQGGVLPPDARESVFDELTSALQSAYVAVAASTGLLLVAALLASRKGTPLRQGVDQSP